MPSTIAGRMLCLSKCAPCVQHWLWPSVASGPEQTEDFARKGPLLVHCSAQQPAAHLENAGQHAYSCRCYFAEIDEILPLQPGNLILLLSRSLVSGSARLTQWPSCKMKSAGVLWRSICGMDSSNRRAHFGGSLVTTRHCSHRDLLWQNF